MSRVGLFGGSFDPVHLGHLLVAEEMLRLGPLDRLLFVPAGVPPHKPTGTEAGFANRLRMLELSIECEARFGILDVEGRRPGLSYSVDTLEWLAETGPRGEEYRWILGSDGLADLPGWKNIDRFLELAPPLVAYRRGSPPDPVGTLSGKLPPNLVERIAAGMRPSPVIEISSTDIRRRVRAGESIHYLVLPSVEDYIDRQGLYLSCAPGERGSGCSLTGA